MFEYLIAFGAGLISFLSPCVLPLIPGYISYISGQSLKEILNKKEINFFPLILFCLGFSTVFVILGASASFLGQILLQNSEILRIAAGIIIIIFSLQLIGIINITYLNFEKRFDAKESRNILFPYVIGVAFGFGWTPCIGPILGSILALASIEETLSRAVILLISYSLGLAIPFVLFRVLNCICSFGSICIIFRSDTLTKFRSVKNFSRNNYYNFFSSINWNYQYSIFKF